MLTDAPATTAPLGSATVPEIPPRNVCPSAGVSESTQRTATNPQTLRANMISSPPAFDGVVPFGKNSATPLARREREARRRAGARSPPGCIDTALRTLVFPFRIVIREFWTEQNGAGQDTLLKLNAQRELHLALDCPDRE